MKQLLNIIFLLSLPLASFAQKKQAISWIPQKYITNIQANGMKPEYNIYLQPVENIIYENGKYYVQTYRGMLQPVVSTKKSGKIAVKGLSVNLNYFTRKEQDSINKVKYYIVDYKDSLLLEMHNNTTIKSVKYIKDLNGYKFEEPIKTIRKILLAGKYEVFNDEGQKAEPQTEITLNGTIKGNSLFTCYNLKRVQVPDANNNLYDLIEFHSTNMKAIKKLALMYNEKEKSWLCYSYQTLKDKYTIQISPNIVFKFKRIN